MTIEMALILAAAALAPGSAAAAPKSGASSQSAPTPAMKALAESCNAHKFETEVEVGAAGKTRQSKVKLCGKVGQSDADWVNTLKDAANKIEANPTMARSVKDQIIAALNAEMARLAPVAVSIAPPVVAVPPPPMALPPLPPQPAVAARPRPPARVAAPAKPQLSFQCFTPGELGFGGPCVTLENNTLLTVRAGEDLAGGARLRFLRDGNPRGEVAIGPMRRGQRLQFKLPQKICAGVARSQVEIQIFGGGSAPGGTQPADTLGPYELRC